eukprot:COSAG01_NODE_54033_length_335_cov_0.542373_1_plen_30_part_01
MSDHLVFMSVALGRAEHGRRAQHLLCMLA